MRRNTKFLQPTELDDANAESEQLDGTVFTVASSDLVNTMLVQAKCKICSAGDMEIVRDNPEYGLPVKLRLMCMNCSGLL